MKYFRLYFKLAFFSFFLFQASVVRAQFYKDIFTQKAQDASGFSDKQQESLKNALQSDVKYLCSDKLQGRRTGSYGEQLAGMYIQRRMEQGGIGAFGNSFRHTFKFITGKQITPESRLTIDRKFIFIPEEAFPAPFSAAGEDNNFVLPDSKEAYAPWLIPLYQSPAEAHDPGFDWEAEAYRRAKNAEARGATSVVFYDEYGSNYAPKFTTRTVFEPLDIPVIIMLKKAYDEHVKGMAVMKAYSLTVKFKNSYQEGNNVIGYIDNNAPLSVVIGAHYDHLGHGEDLGIHGGREIYNGANDNASGVAVMLSLAGQIHEAGFKKYNYIFIAFSGEEQGLSGAKAFLAAKGFNHRKIAFMINLDKVGIPNAAQNLYIGGMETASSWQDALAGIPTKFKIIKEPLSGLAASDHIPFYKDSIPVLFFTTGSYPDHHKPTDDFQKINYPATVNVMEYVFNLIGKMDKQPVPLFGSAAPESITPAPAVSSVPTKHPFGISPDNDYKGIGIRIAKIAEGSAAYNAKMQEDDILLQIGKKKINNMEDYKSAVSSLRKGSRIMISVKRGPTVQRFSLIY